MAHPDNKFFSVTLPDSPDFPYRFFCKLFDDMIIRSVCIMRRAELNDLIRFSCTGCSKDRMITAMSKRSAVFRTDRP
jgi:hypothetical protein